jgi:hypothetical protein
MIGTCMVAWDDARELSENIHVLQRWVIIIIMSSQVITNRQAKKRDEF